MSNTFYVTTPIYYVNSNPHLGHLYTTIIADSVARFHRQRGKEVFFLTGTDEHGQNIERAAAERDLPVEEHVNRYVQAFQDAFAPYGFTNNHWVRTTHDYHKQAAQELWRRAAANGFIYKGKYEGWYCANCNQFYLESEFVIEEGKPPVCPTHDRPLDKLAEESYFFKLSAFQEKLLALYESHPDFIRPEARRNEMLSFVKSGLNDLSVSRTSVKWGIPVPDDPEHTMYVWFDALSNYITAMGFGGFKNDWQSGGESHYKKYWPANLQLVGKDILRFHTVYWPAFLMAAGEPVPQSVFAHGMWLSGGRKMSKTLGNVIDLAVLRKHFTTDAVRYFCLREMSFGQDGDFTYEALLERTNADLASGLGNLASRTLTMVKNYCDGVLPRSGQNPHNSQILASATSAQQSLELVRQEFDQAFSNYSFNRAIEVVWQCIASTDGFLSHTAPWILVKDETARPSVDFVLRLAADVVRYLTVLLSPVLPNATQQLWEQLGETGNVSEVNPITFLLHGDEKRIGEIKPVFPRLDKGKVMEEIKKEEAPIQPAGAAPVVTPAPVVEALAPVAEPTYIGIDDFTKVELRVGQILTAEPVPKADKLLRFTIDLGEAEPRQILAGIAQYYEYEKLIGRKVIVVANLAPRKLRGFESQGMILAASIGEEGKPVLAGFLEEVPNGAKLR